MPRLLPVAAQLLAVALTALACAGSASAAAPAGSGQFTRAGAPVFAQPLDGLQPVYFSDHAGAAVGNPCTVGSLPGQFVRIHYLDSPNLLLSGLGAETQLRTGFAHAADVRADPLPDCTFLP
jgi:hypothetical protein